MVPQNSRKGRWDYSTRQKSVLYKKSRLMMRYGLVRRKGDIFMHLLLLQPKLSKHGPSTG